MRIINILLLSLVVARRISAWIVPAARISTTRLFYSNRLLSVDSLRNTYCALRHGRSLANEAKLISSNPNIATVTHGLSKVGREQARAAGTCVVDYFVSHNFDGIVIIASDYLRAKETATIVSEAVLAAELPLLDGGAIIEIRLRERWFGEWDGGSDQHYPDVWKDDAVDSSHTLRGVESVDSVMDRTTECILDWDSRLHNHLIVLVAHGDVLQITQTAFAKMDGSNHRNVDHLETATLRPLELMA
jgi:broad specificity phosphatase PhoE